MLFFLSPFFNDRPHRHRDGPHRSPRVQGRGGPAAIQVGQDPAWPPAGRLDRRVQQQPGQDARHVRLQAVQGGISLLGHAVQD